ncbi:MAG: 30S ribosomal protein S13 [Candidatus Hodarchaeales archaeon]|jgi:ribosomal protein S13
MSTDDFNHIVRIAGTDLAGEWYVGHALSRIRGVGVRLSHLILKKAKIPLDVRIGFLTDDEVKNLEELIENPVEKANLPHWLTNRQHDLQTGEFKHLHGQEIDIYLKFDLDRMKKIRAYKGIRHALGLRVRGQHTRTTGRRKGRAVGVHRKKARQ